MTRSMVPMAFLVLTGCISGSLPTIRTDRIDVSGVSTQGLTLDVRVIANNERHSGTIHIDALRVHVILAGRDLGTLDLPESVDLPPNQPVAMDTQVTVPIDNLPELALTAASGPVPYHIDGRAHVENIGWTVDFSYDGEVPQQQIIDAAAGALPFGGLLR